MTDNQKRQILILRKEGYGYSRIASKLGISQNTVNLSETEESTCLQCGAPRETTVFFQVNSEMNLSIQVRILAHYGTFRYRRLYDR